MTHTPSNQQLAAERFAAFDAEMRAFTYGAWATMTDVEARDALGREIEDRHGYKHGWIVVNGESFNHERAFPDQFFPRFPADQGTSD